MERPKDRKSLERFIGIINYLSKFIKNYSEITAPLRLLLKKNILWHWEEEQEQAFIKLKSALTKPPVLQFYNVNKPLVLSVDASKACLGAVLMQEEKPIAYFSRALTSTQCNYAQIEKELLAILVGCERFHQYIYGKPITVETDHKPLVSIIGKPLADCPLRLQRMFLRLQQYDIKLVYKPGKQLIIADALSRLDLVNVNCISGNQLDKDIEAQVALVLNKIEWSEQQFEKIRIETDKDEDLVRLKRIITEGWPSHSSDIITNLNYFRTVKDHLSIYREIIFKNDQMVIPKSMRKEVLRVLHTGHLGSEKTKIRARESVYWPGINIDIENLVMKCEACASHRNLQTREPLQSHEIPRKQWHKVGMDLFQFNNNHYLLIVDYYTKYFETIQISKLNSISVISHIKFIFSRLGIPEIVISDNGPQFSSVDFKQFAKEWDFKHITSSPLYPQSNGLAERFVQTIKNTLKKCKMENTDPYIAMLELRNSSIYDRYSPTELMYGRKIRGVIPNLIKKKINHSEYYNTLRKQQKVQQNYYNKKSKPLKPLNKDEKIRIRKEGIWQKGTIIDKCNRPRSYKVKLENGQIYERNRKHIRKDGTDDKISKSQNEPITEKSVSQPQYYLHTDDMYWRNLQSNKSLEASEELIDEQDIMLVPSEESDDSIVDTTLEPESSNRTYTMEDALADDFAERLSLSPIPQYSSRGRKLQKTTKYWLNKSSKKK